jgi:hypothetical protein
LRRFQLIHELAAHQTRADDAHRDFLHGCERRYIAAASCLGI